jgi:hypothetical protein
MGIRLKAPFIATVKGGGVFTFVGTAAKQAVYWMLSAIDPRPGMGPWPAVGRLQRPRYRIGKVRYGTRFRYGIAVPYSGIVRWKPPEVDDHITLTDESLRATDIYLAPDHLPLVRYGCHYKFGEVKWGEPSGFYDRVTAKAVLD